MSNGDSKYRSRKWMAACFVEITATIIVVFVVYKLQDKMMTLLPFLTWWGGVSAGVLALYQAGLITDKKLNGPKR